MEEVQALFCTHTPADVTWSLAKRKDNGGKKKFYMVAKHVPVGKSTYKKK